PAVIVLGVGMTITVAPLTTAVMEAVEPGHAGIASGINNAMSRTAGLLAIAVLGIVVLSVFTSSLDSHLAALHLSTGVQHHIDVQRTRLAGIVIPMNVSNGVQISLKRAIDESFLSSFRLISFISAALALVGAMNAWLLIDGKKPIRAGSAAQEQQSAASE